MPTSSGVASITDGNKLVVLSGGKLAMLEISLAMPETSGNA